MPNTRCANCGGAYAWRWEEAFDKFGFGDGDGQVMTDMVAQVLREAGYTVETHPWGMHNVVKTFPDVGSVAASATGGAQKLMLRFRRVRIAADLLGKRGEHRAKRSRMLEGARGCERAVERRCVGWLRRPGARRGWREWLAGFGGMPGDFMASLRRKARPRVWERANP